MTMTERIAMALSQASSHNRLPLRWRLGRVTWTKLRAEAPDWVPAEVTDRTTMFGLPVEVDDNCGPGFGLVVQ